MATRYQGNNFNFVVGDSELLDGSPVVQNNKPPAGSLAVTQQTIQFEHIVRPEFNYLAKSYNDSLQTKDERLLKQRILYYINTTNAK